MSRNERNKLKPLRAGSMNVNKMKKEMLYGKKKKPESPIVRPS